MAASEMKAFYYEYILHVNWCQEHQDAFGEKNNGQLSEALDFYSPLNALYIGAVVGLKVFARTGWMLHLRFG